MTVSGPTRVSSLDRRPLHLPRFPALRAADTREGNVQQPTTATTDDPGPAPASGLRRPPVEGPPTLGFRPLALRALAVATLVITAGVVVDGLGDLRRRSRSLGPTVGFVVATRDLPLGTRLQPADLRLELRPTRTAPPDTARATGAVVGRTLAFPLLAGDLVRDRILAPSGVTGLAALVPPGHRAVRIRPADGSRPPAGATVDVLAVTDAATGAPAGSATTVAGSATVLASRVEADGRTTVTVLVTASAASAVVAASVAGRIGLALAPPPSAGEPDPPPPVG